MTYPFAEWREKRTINPLLMLIRRSWRKRILKELRRKEVRFIP